MWARPLAVWADREASKALRFQGATGSLCAVSAVEPAEPGTPKGRAVGLNALRVGRARGQIVHPSPGLHQHIHSGLLAR